MEKLRHIARDRTSNEGNLLEASVEAARNRCTLGEISQSLEDIFSRHVADSRLVSGAYRETFDDQKQKDELKNVIQRVEVRSFSPFSSSLFRRSFIRCRNSPKLKVDVLEFSLLNWVKMDTIEEQKSLHRLLVMLVLMLTLDLYLLYDPFSSLLFSSLFYL